MSKLRSRLLARVAAPAQEPLTLNEAKLYLRLTHDDEDSLLSDLIVAARMTAENWLKRSLITQSWKLAYDGCIPECVTLPMGPVNSITSVIIVNADNSTQTVSSTTYHINAAHDALIFQSAVIGFRIEIIYATGYGNDEDVPRPIKQGMLAHIASMYDSRGEGGDMTLPAQTITLYMPYRGVAL